MRLLVRIRQQEQDAVISNTVMCAVGGTDLQLELMELSLVLILS